MGNLIINDLNIPVVDILDSLRKAIFEDKKALSINELNAIIQRLEFEFETWKKELNALENTFNNIRIHNYQYGLNKSNIKKQIDETSILFEFQQHYYNYLNKLRLHLQKGYILLSKVRETFSNQEIRALTEFQERFFKSEIIRDSNYLEFNKSIPELSVTNLENSLKFYKTIGFKIEYDRPENKFVFISLGKIQFMLQEISNNDKWNVMELTYPFGNGINFQLEVDNVNEIYKELKENNYKITFEIEENWYRQGNRLLGNKEFLIQDPDGYLLRFFEDLGEK